jgi:predicted site-specific integrase-resolvase
VKWQTTGQVAGDYGVTTQTIRRWINNGEFKHVRQTRGGQFRIGIIVSEQYVGYARVSSRKQVSSLESQATEIHASYPKIKIITDIGSGFNFKRKGFVSLLELALSGVAIHIVVSNRDRLSRVGFEFIKTIFERSGGTTTPLNKEGDESDQFSTELLVGFITSFCNSYYGRRSAHNKRSKPEDKNLPQGSK